MSSRAPSFRSLERQRQLAWKARTTTLSDAAKRPGRYRGEGPRNAHFLHEDHAAETLLPAIREEALRVFVEQGLDWHDGPTPDRPSPYLADSQVSCVNTLLPFAHDPAAMAALWRPVVPDATGALPVEEDRLVAFEWLGDGNPLGERSPERRRGAYGTSLDAWVVLDTPRGRVGLAVEWKRTERYAGRHKPWALRDYGRWFGHPDGPLLGDPGDYTADPLYQLARGQCLCWRIEEERQGSVERVVFVVVAPQGNRAYRDHPAPQWPGETALDGFARRLRQPDRFAVSTPDALLAGLDPAAFPHLAPTLAELSARYGEAP